MLDLVFRFVELDVLWIWEFFMFSNNLWKISSYNMIVCRQIFFYSISLGFVSSNSVLRYYFSIKSFTISIFLFKGIFQLVRWYRNLIQFNFMESQIFSMFLVSCLLQLIATRRALIYFTPLIPTFEELGSTYSTSTCFVLEPS